MTEAFLVLSNLLFGIAILAYIYFKDVRNHNDDQTDKERMADFFSGNIDLLRETSKENMDALIDLSKSKDELFQKTFTEYLKHNEKLEKMILPQPVTRKAVEDILFQTGPMVPNEIDKNDAELEKEQLDEMISRIPINKDTKVLFEDDLQSDGGLGEEILT